MQIFGERLLKPIEDYAEMKQLPSPNELQGKIIVKLKRHSVNYGNKRISTTSEDFDEEASDDETDGGRRNLRFFFFRILIQSPSDAHNHHLNVVEELSRLCVLTVPLKFRNIKQALENAKQFNIMSISEPKAKALIAEDIEKFRQLAKQTMLRIYPRGTRFDSSNYNPSPLWSVGAQVVALNYQCVDDDMKANYGKFRDNGNSGFLLKPEYLLSRSSEQVGLL